MKFKANIIEHKTMAEKEEIKIEDIFLQPQVKDDNSSLSAKNVFSLKWRVTYKDGTFTDSEWTPSIIPSITRTTSIRNDIERLLIFGKNTAGQFVLELANIKFSLVKNFGYIAEQIFGREGKSEILGIWVELTENRTLRILRNGMIKEKTK